MKAHAYNERVVGWLKRNHPELFGTDGALDTSKLSLEDYTALLEPDL